MKKISSLENLTVLFYLISAALTVTFFLRERQSVIRRLLSITSVLAVVCLLDELSFGEKFFGFAAPQFAGENINAVHDLFDVARAIWSQAPRAYKATALLIFMAGFVALSLLYWRNLLYVMSLVAQNCSYLALAAFTMLGLIALILDQQELMVATYLVFIEELCEMNAALALILVGMGSKDWQKTGSRLRLGTALSSAGKQVQTVGRS